MKIWETLGGCRIVRVLAGRSNVYLVDHPKMKILVDTSPTRKWRKLKSRLHRLGIEKFDFLVLTHTHFDHVGNAQKIKEQFNAKVIVHRSETHLLSEAISKIPAGTNHVTRFLVNRLGKRASSIARFDSCQPDILVDLVFRFNEYGLNAYLLHTPGHTAGSISLIVDDEIAIVGDAMFGIFPHSIFPPFADDIKELKISWDKLLNTKCKLFLPAHGTGNSRKLVLKLISKTRVAVLG